MVNPETTHPNDQFFDYLSPAQQQSLHETHKLAAIVTNISFTGLLGAGLVASAIQPENSFAIAALGAVLLIPTGNAVRKWCRQRRVPENPEPLGDVLKTTVNRIKDWGWISLAAIGAAAIATTMLAAHVAKPDYDYAYLKNSTSSTRLADPGASNKKFNKDNLLQNAAWTLTGLSEATRGNAAEKGDALKQSMIDYLRATVAKEGTPAYKNLFSAKEAETIGAAPYLRELLPASVTSQYITQAFATVKNVPLTAKGKEISGEAKTEYVQALTQLCKYANNPETKEAVNQSWLATATKVTYNRTQKTPTSSPFQKGIQEKVTEACSDNSFMPSYTFAP